MTDGDPSQRQTPSRHSTSLGTLLTGLLVLLAPQSGQAQLFEDPPAIIQGSATLSEQQNDHVEAVTLFAHGRVLLQRGSALEGAERQAQFAVALRRFQRAWWFDHELVNILEDIVPLSFELDRQFEATRYLIIAAEQQEVPAEILERVAAELADLDQFDAAESRRALKLYRKLKQRQGDSVNAITEFQIGRLALATGQYAEAATSFAAVEQAMEDEASERISARMREQLLKRPEATYALFGESYLRAKQLDEAEAAFRRADQGKPDPANLAFRLALVEQERGNSAKAIELLQGYFDAKTKSAGLGPYVLLTELLDGPIPQQGESPAADAGQKEEPESPPRKPSNELIEKLQTFAQPDASNPLLGYYLADALRRAERWDAAEVLYQKLMKQEPAADGHQGLADIYRRQKRLAPLLAQLSAVVAETGSLDALDRIADEIAQDEPLMDQLVREAQSQAADAEGTPPDGAWFALALLQAAAGRNEAAMPLFEKGLQQPHATAGPSAVNLAFAMFPSNHPELAVQIFQQILNKKLLPDRSPEVHFYLAGAWTLAKDYDQALAAAQEAARLEPKSPRMHTREAWVLFQAQRLPEARAKYIELLDRFDSDHTSLENREVMRDIRMALSAIDVERKETAAAEEWLQQTLDEFPEDIGAYNDLGYLWSDQGKHLNRSLQMIQLAIEAEPDNIAYLDSLGWAFYRLGRYDEAIPPLEQATASSDADGVILDHLGDAYVKANQPIKAVETWRKAATVLKEKGNAERLEAIEAKIKQHAQQ